MYKFVAYIPENALDMVKNALFMAGAGNFGNYDQCSWQTLGIGQFRPLQGANPAIGKIDVVETVAEWRVEMIVPDDKIHAVVKAYKNVHPYEEPAYDIYDLIDIKKFF